MLRLLRAYIGKGWRGSNAGCRFDSWALLSGCFSNRRVAVRTCPANFVRRTQIACACMVVSFSENARILLTLVLLDWKDDFALFLLETTIHHRSRLRFILPERHHHARLLRRVLILILTGRNHGEGRWIFQICFTIVKHELLDLANCMWISASHCSKRLHIDGLILAVFFSCLKNEVRMLHHGCIEPQFCLCLSALFTLQADLLADSTQPLGCLLVS